MGRYTYGDSDLAADRIELVAQVFEPASRAFLEGAAPSAPALAVDLGCGSGHTTRLLQHVTGASSAVGLDGSASLLRQARASADPRCSFAEHDVTRVPFPTGPADVIYARLLLAHLTEPIRRILDWTSQLGPGGVLLVDDLEVVETGDPVFRAYLDEVAFAVIRRQGGAVFAGPTVHAMADPPGTRRAHDDIATFAPDPTVTARIFSMNLAVLTDREEIDERGDLVEGLAAIADGRVAAEPVVWSMRQIAFRRSA